MITIKENSFLKYILFGSLYFSEGIQLAIATVLIPVYFIEKQFSPMITTLVIGLIMIPWAIKFVFGWTVDHYSRYGRKKFILSGGIISALSLIILSALDPSTVLIPFIIILFIGHCGVQFLDVSADAWAIEISRKKEHGKINSSMVAGIFTGTALGSSLFTYIAKNINYNTSFLIAGLITISIITFPIIIKEIKKDKIKKRISNILIKEFKKKSMILIILFLSIVTINSGIITISIPIFMNLSLNLDVFQIGLISTVFIISRIIGSVICGTLSDIISRKKIIIYIMMLSIIISTSFIFIQNWQNLIIIYAIFGFLNGGLISTLFAFCMDITNSKVSATHFSILVSIANAGELFGSTSSGSIISLSGFSKVFLFSAWIFGPALLLFYFIKNNKK